MTETLEKRDEGGFFTIYKRGHGYRTRLLTVGSGLLLSALTANFVYKNVNGNVSQQTAMIIGVAVFVLLGLIVHWATNRPTSAEFLIATDSEMKKVNWISRADLIGSTKIVIVFMFLIAIFLFIVDQLFAFLFYLIGVMHKSPF